MIGRDGCGLLVVVRAKIESGKLPITRPEKVWAGYGRGCACDVCDQRITAADAEYEADLPDGRTLHFHQACLGLWHQERARFLPPSG
jgi:hypothetical protein